jgi:hypothetical protein
VIVAETALQEMLVDWAESLSPAEKARAREALERWCERSEKQREVKR